MTTCPHGEPHPSCCLDCLDGTPPPPPPKPVASNVIAARYNGLCALDYGHTIEVGDLIGCIDRDTWACPRCYRRAT